MFEATLGFGLGALDLGFRFEGLGYRSGGFGFRVYSCAVAI